MTPQPLISIDGLRAYYRIGGVDTKAVDDVSFSVEENEILGIVGESGCGKSTLARAILNLVEPPCYIVDGKIMYGGNDLLSLDEERLRKIRWEHLAYIPQSSMYALNPTMRVQDQITDAIKAHSGKSSRERGRNVQGVQELLDIVGLPRRVARMYPHELSGGMRQRVCIAMAIALRPRVLIADEPTTALDVVVQKGVLQALTSVQKMFENSIVLISHNIAVQAEVTDRLAVMYAGRIVEVGDVNDLFEQPLHPYTQGLMASVPSIEEKEISGIAGLPPDLTNPPPGCRFHLRCPMAKKECMVVEPELREIEPGHFVACILYSSK